MRPILCVTDLTETAGHVVEVAAKMAYAYKSNLIILFPYRLIDTEYTGEVSTLKIKLEKEAREKFFALKQQLFGLDLIAHEFQPEIGFPVDRINAFVRRNKVDSIVISQRQANLINDLNSLTLQNLIASAKLPFVIVPEEIDVDVFTQ